MPSPACGWRPSRSPPRTAPHVLFLSLAAARIGANRHMIYCQDAVAPPAVLPGRCYVLVMDFAIEAMVTSRTLHLKLCAPDLSVTKTVEAVDGDIDSTTA